MASAQSTKVPRGWEEFFAGITAITDQFCRDHLNEEYAQLARYALAAPCMVAPVCQLRDAMRSVRKLGG